MLVTNGILTHKYEQNHRPSMFLGRHLELDARSLQYTLNVEELRRPVKPSEFLAPIPTLDQGQLGSCTGNAGTRMIAWLHKDNLFGTALNGHNLSDDATADEAYAVELYHQATINDGFQGTYPPEDTGSSGLGVCRSLKAAGLLSRYVHATSLRSMAVLLQTGPIIVGMPWYDAFFSPIQSFIDGNTNWQASGIAGGHEIYGEAVEAWDDMDPGKCIFRFHNSWGGGWGDKGCFRMRGSTYNALRQQIDVMQGRL